MILDADVIKIQQEIRAKWADANVQIMRAFLARLKEVSLERKRINYARIKLREAIDVMITHFPELDKVEEHAKESGIVD